jgi:hypothetical protein
MQTVASDLLLRVKGGAAADYIVPRWKYNFTKGLVTGVRDAARSGWQVGNEHGGVAGGVALGATGAVAGAVVGGPAGLINPNRGPDEPFIPQRAR